MNNTNTLHYLTHVFRDSLARVGYKKPNVLRFKSDLGNTTTNGLTVWLPSEFHGHIIDSPKPTKTARRVARSMIHLAAMQLVYRASKDIRKSVKETEVDSRLVNLALRIHADKMIRFLWSKRLDRKIDTFAKRIERKHMLPKLVSALAEARRNGNQRDVNHCILSICHLISPSQPISYRQNIKTSGGTIIPIITSADEAAMVKEFLKLRARKFKINDLPSFISAIPQITGWANAGNRPTMSAIQALLSGMLPDDSLTTYADLQESDADYGLHDFRDDIMAYEESRDTSNYTGGGGGGGGEMTEADDEDDTVSVEADDVELIELVPNDFDTGMLDRMSDDCLTMQYRAVYDKKRGGVLPAAAQLAQRITLKLKDKGQVTKQYGVMDTLDIMKAATERPSEDVFYQNKLTHKPSDVRSVAICVDISPSMAGAFITLAMTSAQALALAIKNTQGYCAGFLFNGVGYASPELTDSPLFRPDPFGVTGTTNFQFLREVWLRLPHSTVIVLTDGHGPLPHSILEEDRERTFVITLDRSLLAQLEQLGSVEHLAKLSELPDLMTSLVMKSQASMNAEK